MREIQSNGVTFRLSCNALIMKTKFEGPSSDVGKERQYMKTLENIFKRSGFTFKQRHRQGNLAIYAKRQEHWADDHWTYELIRIKQLPAGEIFGKQLPEREAYPSSENFGVSAWACTTYGEALKRLGCLDTLQIWKIEDVGVNEQKDGV